ncbi:MAG: hypothetical protein AAF688_02970 [Bacteroidota bacterium]
MANSLLKTIPNLKPFDFDTHHDSLLLNQEWILVNGIDKKKSVYTFKEDNILKISEKENTTETTWTVDIKNVFSIETEDGIITVKAYFKDDDVLVLNHQDKKDIALFINESNYSTEVNTMEDVKIFLKEKYRKKVSKLINKHEFYYIHQSEEFGPVTVETLSKKVKNDEISPYCFVRDINEENYAKRLRICELIKEV